MSQAIVIGGGIAGLATARVLADHFERVIIVDRDHFPTSPSFRSGTPQAHHIHVLLLEGQHLLEDTLARMTRGATALPAGREFQLLELLEAPERGSDSCESGGGESNKPRSYSNLSHARNSRTYRDPRVHRRLDHPDVVVCVPPGRHERRSTTPGARRHEAKALLDDLP